MYNTIYSVSSFLSDFYNFYSIKQHTKQHTSTKRPDVVPTDGTVLPYMSGNSNKQMKQLAFNNGNMIEGRKKTKTKRSMNGETNFDGIECYIGNARPIFVEL